MLGASTPSPWWTVLATVAGGVIVMVSNLLIEWRRSKAEDRREHRRIAMDEMARHRLYHREVNAVLERHILAVAQFVPAQPDSPEWTTLFDELWRSHEQVAATLASNTFLASQALRKAVADVNSAATLPAQKMSEGALTQADFEAWAATFGTARAAFDDALAAEYVTVMNDISYASAAQKKGKEPSGR